MVDVTMEGEAYAHWAKKEYWTVMDVLNIHFGGVDNLTEMDQDKFDCIKDKVNVAIASGELKSTSVKDDLCCKRDDWVKWAHQNLPHFPFEPSDFEPVHKKKRPGTDREETLLRMIGVLAMLLAEKSKVYKKGDVPNQSQIAIAASNMLDHLQREKLKTEGLKQANFRDAISQGLKLLIGE